jgi:hypothetical protein
MVLLRAAWPNRNGSEPSSAKHAYAPSAPGALPYCPGVLGVPGRAREVWEHKQILLMMTGGNAALKMLHHLRRSRNPCCVMQVLESVGKEIERDNTVGGRYVYMYMHVYVPVPPTKQTQIS